MTCSADLMNHRGMSTLSESGVTDNSFTEDAKCKAKPRDINQLVDSMRRELDYYQSEDEYLEKGLNQCLIYRVQRHIREVSRFSYEPLILSIGPYHHGSVALQGMEKNKWGYLDEVIKLNCKRNLLDYLTAISELAREARMCYSETIKMDSEDFLQMLLLDACIIFVALASRNMNLSCTQKELSELGDLQEIVIDDAAMSSDNTAKSGGNQKDDSETQSEAGGQWFIVFVNHDLLLLENQIPFFVVQRVYDVVRSEDSDPSLLAEEIAKFVEAALRTYPKAIKESGRPKHFHHLLHLCHMYFRPSQKVPEDHHSLVAPKYFCRFLSFRCKYLKLGKHLEESDKQQQVYSENEFQLNRWRRAVQYIEAGVHFQKREFDHLNPHSLLDVKFSNGTLEVPCLFVDEFTEFLFRNLIAFEQTCPQFGDDFTAFIVFLSQLASMPEDVTLLATKGIIVHHLDSDAKVADLFTMLSKDVVFDFNGNYYLKSLCQNLEARYQSNLNRWMAWLWLNHFSNPWLALGAVATVIVLICTVVQTVFGILAYINASQP